MKQILKWLLSVVMVAAWCFLCAGFVEYGFMGIVIFCLIAAIGFLVLLVKKILDNYL